MQRLSVRLAVTLASLLCLALFAAPVHAQTTITKFTPTSGSIGTAVVLTGTGFTGATTVGFTGAHASFTVNSDTQITTSVPSGAVTGQISVAAPGARQSPARALPSPSPRPQSQALRLRVAP